MGFCALLLASLSWVFNCVAWSSRWDDEEASSYSSCPFLPFAGWCLPAALLIGAAAAGRAAELCRSELSADLSGGSVCRQASSNLPAPPDLWDSSPNRKNCSLNPTIETASRSLFRLPIALCQVMGKKTVWRGNCIRLGHVAQI